MRLIDADALEELFRETISHISKNPKMTGNLEHMVRASAMVIEMIKDAPTIEPQKWIPCTPETMPEEAGAYLCTCKDAGRLIITLIKWQPRMKSWNLTGTRTYWKVIAWMPLPEPYKEGKE